MKELWERRGYANLGLTSQNYLRDQAARLEKTMGNLSGNTNENEDTRLEEDVINSTKENQGKIEADNRDITGNPMQFQRRDARFTVLCRRTKFDTRENVTKKRASTRLPKYNHVDKPSMVEWGKDSDGAPIIIQTSCITQAYNEIISWRKKCFSCPIWESRKRLH